LRLLLLLGFWIWRVVVSLFLVDYSVFKGDGIIH
jgi:hypothetical protein